MTAQKAKKRSKVPRPPGSLPREAAVLWRKLAPGLRSSHRLRDEQLPAFEMLCLHYSLARQAAKQLGRDGPSTIDERGLIRKHPAHQVMREHSEQFRQLADRFGLTPKSRNWLKVPDAAPVSLAAMLLAGIHGQKEALDDDES